ncbi:TIGR03086 family protein [Desertihabitans brevis]|uniref:TIGR03086 family protein n=1 Tax=Desertihabitans brevis TaxID=2268447 RepID=A0A367YY51_9ACTN|nr:TIGR03086 family metal-binding protein [Desertihabitans brevis]RCK69942.1 TIGR03086 family protein [Desertihabitans brevis]
MARGNDQVAALSAAMEQMAIILAGVREEHRRLPTPCAGWDVEALVGHVVAGPRNFALMGGGGTPDWDARQEVPLQEAATRFRTGADELWESWQQGDSGNGLAGFAAAEFAVHAWDLARATGQSIQLDPAVAQAALAVMQESLTEENRGDAFGAEVPVSQNEPAYARLAAFAGRDPHRYGVEEASSADSDEGDVPTP